MENTRYDAVQQLIGDLNRADKALEEAIAVNWADELIRKFRGLGDVRASIARLGQITTLCRSFRTERTLPTLAAISKTQPTLQKMSALLEAIGNLNVLKERIAALQEIEQAIFTKQDLGDFYKRLRDPADLAESSIS